MLLRHFAPAAAPEQIWQLRVDSDEDAMLVKIEDAAVVKHYYTMYRDRPSKEDDWFWEDLLAEWEGKAATALRRLATDPDHLAAPAGFMVVLQMLRTPLGQTLLGDQAAAERKRVFGSKDMRVWTMWWAERKGRLPELDEWIVLRDAARAASVGDDPPLLAVGPTTILDEMLTVVRHSGFAERLWDDGHWNTLNDDMGRFIIGDEPVTYYGQDNPARPIWAQGSLAEELTMPLSPTQCIEVSRGKRHLGLDDSEIEAVNLRAVEWATRFIYGPDPEALQQWRTAWKEAGSPTPPSRRRDIRRRR